MNPDGGSDLFQMPHVIGFYITPGQCAMGIKIVFPIEACVYMCVSEKDVRKIKLRCEN